MNDLQGVVVATTRAGDGEDDALAMALRGRGARVVHWPTMRFMAPDDPSALAEAVAGTAPGDWIAFTSARAVAAVVTSCPRNPAGVRVAAVGSATADALQQAGWSAELVGAGGAAALVDDWAARTGLDGARVLFPAGSLARSTLEDALAQHGARVSRIEAYRTCPAPPDRGVVLADLERGVDVVTFASPSAVYAMRDSLGADWASAFRMCGFAVIGDTTREALEECDVDPDLVVIAETASMDGLAAAAARAARRDVPRNSERST